MRSRRRASSRRGRTSTPTARRCRFSISRRRTPTATSSSFFRGSDVISTGDIFRTDGYPVIDAAKGGTLQGELDALNTILDITVPERNQMGGTRVIPGHGRICNEADVLEYRDMLTIIRDRVRDMVKKNMTLEQVKAARPTLEYDGIYGTRKEWTGAMFIEAVYKELAEAGQDSSVAIGFPKRCAASRSR